MNQPQCSTCKFAEPYGGDQLLCTRIREVDDPDPFRAYLLLDSPVDGSAALIVTRDFGCVLHETNAITQGQDRSSILDDPGPITTPSNEAGSEKMTRLFKAVQNAGGIADWDNDNLQPITSGYEWSCPLLDVGTLTPIELARAAFVQLGSIYRGSEVLYNVGREKKRTYMVILYLTADYED